MIFLGDIAHPFKDPPRWNGILKPWGSPLQPVIANLEGSLVSDESDYLRHRQLFSNDSIVDTLLETRVKAVCLANNHVTDIPAALERTCSHLRRRGIGFTGAGSNLDEAASPVEISFDGETYLLLSAGWETIQCRPAGRKSAGVYPLRCADFLSVIAHWRKISPDSFLVVMPHWNYEMELYPQPAHRQFAMAAVDEGADAIIGHHPHCVGGIEIYRGRPIAYSLGNWWMPQGVYFNGKLKFGDQSLLQLALEWTSGRDPICHWFQYDRGIHKLTPIGSEALSDSQRVRHLTPFAGMRLREYQRWFSQHRIKNRALPIYLDYRHTTLNAMKDRYVRMRHSILMFMEFTGLRSLFTA